jgi:hypothetical protein
MRVFLAAAAAAAARRRRRRCCNPCDPPPPCDACAAAAIRNALVHHRSIEASDPRLFSVTSRTEIIFMRADTAAERDAWVSTMRRVQAQINESAENGGLGSGLLDAVGSIGG